MTSNRGQVPFLVVSLIGVVVAVVGVWNAGLAPALHIVPAVLAAAAVALFARAVARPLMPARRGPQQQWPVHGATVAAILAFIAVIVMTVADWPPAMFAVGLAVCTSGLFRLAGLQWGRGSRE